VKRAVTSSVVWPTPMFKDVVLRLIEFSTGTVVSDMIPPRKSQQECRFQNIRSLSTSSLQGPIVSRR
jgi:hypothetical protein